MPLKPEDVPYALVQNCPREGARRMITGRLANRSELKPGDKYLIVTGRPTQLHGQHASGLHTMSYIDLAEFPAWRDGEMVVIFDKENKGAG